MRRSLVAFLSLLFLASNALADQWLINSYRFAVTPPSKTFLACGNDGASMNVGTEDPTRMTVVVVFAEDSATFFTIDSLTIGGEAATEVIHTDDLANISVAVAMFRLANPTGTSEVVDATTSEGVTEIDVCTYAVYGLSNQTEDGTGSDERQDVGALDMALTPASGAVGIGGCINMSATGGASWSGLSEDNEANATNFRRSVASTFPAGGSSNVQCTWSGSTAGDDEGGVAAYWNP